MDPNPGKRQTYLSPVIVIVNPSYSFPWSLRLGTFVFTVNPSLVLLLNCFRKKKKKKVMLEWTETDCLVIVLKRLKYMEQKWRWPNWGNRTKSYRLNYVISFILYLLLNGNHKYWTRHTDIQLYNCIVNTKQNCLLKATGKSTELYRFLPKPHADSNLLV